jgi:hypothetical protein
MLAPSIGINWLSFNQTTNRVLLPKGRRRKAEGRRQKAEGKAEGSRWKAKAKSGRQ